MKIARCAVLCLALVSCEGGQSDPIPLTAATTVAPLARLVETVGAPFVMVELVLPVGAEPHHAGLDAEQLDVLDRADVVFFIGAALQPAVEDALRAHPHAIDVLEAVAPSSNDPHVWLDPVAMKDATHVIARELAEADPGGPTFGAGVRTAVHGLDALHREFHTALGFCQRRLMITSHAAVGHLAARYGLEQHGITGVTPGSGPDPKRLSDVIDLVRSSGTTTVLAEAREPDDIARTVARETGARVAVLDPIETIAEGATYDGLMRTNLRVLVDALGCRR